MRARDKSNSNARSFATVVLISRSVSLRCFKFSLTKSSAYFMPRLTISPKVCRWLATPLRNELRTATKPLCDLISSEASALLGTSTSINLCAASSPYAINRLVNTSRLCCLAKENEYESAILPISVSKKFISVPETSLKILLISSMPPFSNMRPMNSSPAFRLRNFNGAPTVTISL